MFFREAVRVMVLLACSVLAYAEKPPEKGVYWHKDAQGRMVFSDEKTADAKELQISKPSVIQGSQLGKKVYYAPAPVAARPGRYEKHPQVAERERMEAKCARLANIAHASQQGRSTYRSAMQDRYDRECIANGY